MLLVKLTVLPVRFLQQVFVASHFHDLTVLHHHNEVRIHNGGKSVGNHKGCATLHHIDHRLLDQGLGQGIQRRRGLIQDQNGRIGQHRSGNGQPLFLPHREFDALISQRRIISLGGPHHKLVNLAHPGRGNHLFFTGIQTAVTQVVFYAGVKQHRILQYLAYLRSKGSQRHIPDIVAINRDFALSHVVEPHQQAGQRRLAAPGVPHQSHHRSWRDLQVDALKNRFPGVVFKPHVLELHMSLDRRQFNGIRLVLDIHFPVQHLVDPLHRYHHPLELGDRIHQVDNRMEHAHRVGLEGHQRAIGHLPLNHKIASDAKYQRVAQPGHHPCPGRAGCLVDHAAHRKIQAVVGVFHKGPVLAPLPAVRLHQLHAGQALLQPDRHLVHLGPPLPPGGADAPNENLVVQDVEREQRRKQQPQLPAQGEAEPHSRPEGDEIGHHGKQAPGHHTPHACHIPHNARHHPPGSHFVVESQGQPEKVPVHLQTDIHNQLVGDV